MSCTPIQACVQKTADANTEIKDSKPKRNNKVCSDQKPPTSRETSSDDKHQLNGLTQASSQTATSPTLWNFTAIKEKISQTVEQAQESALTALESLLPLEMQEDRQIAKIDERIKHGEEQMKLLSRKQYFVSPYCKDEVQVVNNSIKGLTLELDSLRAEKHRIRVGKTLRREHEMLTFAKAQFSQSLEEFQNGWKAKIESEKDPSIIDRLTDSQGTRIHRLIGYHIESRNQVRNLELQAIGIENNAYQSVHDQTDWVAADIQSLIEASDLNGYATRLVEEADSMIADRNKDSAEVSALERKIHTIIRHIITVSSPQDRENNSTYQQLVHRKTLLTNRLSHLDSPLRIYP